MRLGYHIYITLHYTLQNTSPRTTQLAIRPHRLLKYRMPPPQLKLLRNLLRSRISNIKMPRILFAINMPICIQLITRWAGPATPRHSMGGRTVYRESEEVLGLGVVGDEAGAGEEIEEAKCVGEEDENENDVEHAFPVGGGAGCVLLVH